MTIAMLVTGPVAAATSVASVSLQIPTMAHHAAKSIALASYTLDVVADFSLVRLASNATKAAPTRVTAVMAASALGSSFATSGPASQFSSLTIRQADGRGATLRRTVIYDVRVVKIERLTSATGAERRVTFLANRIEDSRGRASD
jgi:hypothetical protein